MPKLKKCLSGDQIKELSNIAGRSKCSEDAKRAQALLFLDDGFTEEQLLKYVGIGKSAAYKLRKKYDQGGIEGILTKKRPPRSILKKDEKLETIEMLKAETPRDYGRQTDFWNTPILVEIIESKYNVLYKSKRPLYAIFEEAKFTYHKPDKQYKNRNQEKIDEWIESNKQIIEDYNNDPEVVLLAEDEMILTTKTRTQKVWLPIGQSPKIEDSNVGKRICLFGYLNVKNGDEHAFKSKCINGDETIKTLEQIGQKYLGKKIVIIWDNGPWHKSEKTKEFLRTTKHNFHLIQFPPYAPELNPQEHVWKAGRAYASNNKFIENIELASDGFVNYLNNTTFNYKFLDLPKLLVEN